MLLRLPDAVIKIPGFGGERWSFSLRRHKGLTAQIKNHPLGDSVICKIINFKISTITNGHLTVVGNEGSEFTPEAIKILEYCRPGSTVVIEKILYQVGCEPMFREFITGLAFNLY